MLPITHHKKLIIPHRLAVIAAGICLVLSFTVDQTRVDESLTSSTSAPDPVEHTVDDAHTDAADKLGGDDGAEGDHGRGLGLLLWPPGSPF
jgi:hypothetical protein